MSRAIAKKWSAPSINDIKNERLSEHLDKMIQSLGSSVENYPTIASRLKTIFDIYVSELKFAERPSCASKHIVFGKAQRLLLQLQQDVFDHLEKDDDTKRLIMDESEGQCDPSDPYGSRFEASRRAVDDLLKWVEFAIGKTPKKSPAGRDGHAEYSAVFELLKLWADVRGRRPTRSEALSFARVALQPKLPRRAKGGVTPLTRHVNRALKELNKISTQAVPI